MRYGYPLVFSLTTVLTFGTACRSTNTKPDSEVRSGELEQNDRDQCQLLSRQGYKRRTELSVDGKAQKMYTLSKLDTGYNAGNNGIMITDLKNSSSKTYNLTREITGDSDKNRLVLDTLAVNEETHRLYVAGSIFSDLKANGDAVERYIIASLDVSGKEPKAISITEVAKDGSSNFKRERLKGFYSMDLDSYDKVIKTALHEDNEGSILGFYEYAMDTSKIKEIEVTDEDEVFDAIKKAYTDHVSDYEIDLQRRRMIYIAGERRDRLYITNFKNSSTKEVDFGPKKMIMLQDVVLDKKSGNVYVSINKLIKREEHDGEISGVRDAVIAKVNVEKAAVIKEKAFDRTDFSYKYWETPNGMTISPDGEYLLVAIDQGGDYSDEDIYRISTSSLTGKKIGRGQNGHCEE
jgi:hypothetical protein